MLDLMSSTRSILGIRLASLAFSLAMLASACTVGNDPRSDTGNVSIDPSSRSFELEGEPMRPCSSDGIDAVCGFLSLPEDRSDPGGRSIELKVVVIPAEEGVPAPDAVFFLAGGPGGAATQTWANSPTLFPGIHETRDIVLVDQRGTGGSNALVLRDLPTLEGLSRREMRTVITGWADQAIASLDGDPRFYTSAVAADDLDDVRAALGYEEIDLYGGSYGATLAQYYVRQHEQHVRAIVLDGGTAVDVPLLELFPRRSQQALESVMKRCGADPVCHEAYPDLERDMNRVMTRLTHAPVTTSVADASGRPVVVDAVALARTLHGSILTHRSGDVPRLVHLAAEGDLEPVASVIAQGSHEHDLFASAMFWSIMCSEPWARFRPERVAELGHGSYLLPASLADAKGYAIACEPFERGVVLDGDARPVRSDVPALLLNGSEDPQDPPGNMAGAMRQLPNSLLVVAPGQGHTVGHLGCLPDVVADFLAAGTVEGLDTSCVAELRPPPFEFD
jgi:pimeloyl-ACP methyl ester carboxylesterase